MLFVFSILLVAINAVWLGLVIFGLPGNWLMVLTTCAFAWWQREQGVFSVVTLVAITVLAVAGELIEFIAGVGGARKAGSSRLISLGAIVGAIFGAILGTVLIPVPVLGTILGASAGAGLVVWAAEIMAGQEMEHSIRRGVGAGMGQLLGILGKVAVGVVIWIVVAVAVFW